MGKWNITNKRTKINYFYWFILIVTTVLSVNSATANPVWKCTSASGQVKFQGSPCLDSDTAQEQLEVSKGNTIAAVPIPTPAEQAVILVVPKSKQHSAPPENNQNKLSLSSCLEYKYELEKIDAEMRAGYSVRRGERLKSRRRHIDSLLWRHCK